MVILQALTIQIDGIVLLIIILAIGGLFGWNRGIRAMISVTLTTAIALAIFVRGGQEVLDIINPLWTNIPRLFAILTGGNPQTAVPLSPLSFDFNLSLFVRLFGFILIAFLLPWVMDRVNFPGWFSANAGAPWARPLGATAGVLVAMLTASAGVGLYQIYLQEGNPPPDNLLGNIVGSLPDLGLFPLVVAALFLGVLLVFNLPKIWS